MSRPVIWMMAVGAGAVAAWLSSLLGWFAVGLVLFLFIPVFLRPVGPAALSGLLTGFGWLWLLLLALQAASGGTTDNLGFWVLVGAVPLVLGLGMLAIIVTRRRRPAAADTAATEGGAING